MQKTVSILVALFLIAALLCGSAALACDGCDESGYLGTMSVVNCNEYVTLRAQPRKSAAAVARVPLGAEVETYHRIGEFTECYYGDLHGYILSAYLSYEIGAYEGNTYAMDDATVADDATGADDGYYMGERTIVNCNEVVTLRRQPSTASAALTRIALGESVECYFYNDDFVICYYNGLRGYVLRRYISGAYGDDYGRCTGTMHVINCREYVTLRATASTSARAVLRVPLGAVVEAYGSIGKFTECVYAGKHGYILTSYLGWEEIYYYDYSDSGDGETWVVY